MWESWRKTPWPAAVLGALAVVAAVGWLLFRVAVESRLDLALLESQVSRALRLRVEITDFSVDLSGTVVLKGLRARDAKGREILTSPVTRARIPPLQVLSGRIVLEGLLMEGPRLTLDSDRLKDFSQRAEGGGGMPFPLEFQEATMSWQEGDRTLALRAAHGRVAAAAPGEPLSLQMEAEGLQAVSARFLPRADGWDLEATIKGLQEALLRRWTGWPASVAGSPAPSPPVTAAPVAAPPPSLDAEVKMARTGDLTTVDAHASARTSWVVGPLHLQAASVPPAGWKGVLDVGKASVAGQAVHSARVPFTWKPPTLQVQEARVEAPQGAMTVSGLVGPGGYSGRLSSPSLQVFTLPGLDQWGVEATPARVRASLDPKGKVAARVDWDRLGRGSTSLPRAWLEVAGGWKGGRLRLEPVQAGRGDERLVKGSVTREGSRPLDVRIQQASAGTLLGLFPGAASLAARGFPVSGTLQWNPDNGEGSGRFQAGPGSVAGQAVQGVQVSLKRPPGGGWTFQGEARALGSRLALEGSLDPLKAKVAGSALRLEALDLARRALPGWTGLVDADLVYEKGSARLGLSASKLVHSGRSVPGVQAHLTRADGRVRIESAALALDPPLPFSGGMDLEEGTLDLVGQLKGQRLAALAGLLPIPKGWDGRLEGEVKVSGPSRQPKAVFQGKVSSLAMPGLAIPEVQLRLVASKKVSLDATAVGVPLEKVAALHKAAPGLQGKARVHLTTKDLPAGMRFEIQADPVTWSGKKVGPVAAVLGWKAPTVRIERLELPLSPPAVVTGTWDTARGLLDLKSSLKGQDLAGLHPFLPSSQALAGRVTGDLALQGPAGKPLVTFSGRGDGLRYGDLALGSATLRLRVALPGEGTLQAGGLRIESLNLLAGLEGALDATALLAPGSAPTLDLALGEATWKGRKLPQVTAHLRPAGEAMKVDPLRAEFAPPVVAVGTVDLGRKTLHLVTPLQGARLADLAVLAPEGMPALEGRLDGSLDVSGAPGTLAIHYEGQLGDLVMAGLHFGSGRVAATVESGSAGLKATMRGTGFPAARVEPLASRYPGLKGVVDFDARRLGEATTVHLTLSQATMTAGPMPDLEGDFTLKGTILAVDRLQAAMSPPLVLKGHYDLTGGGIALDGTLQGQTLGDLIRLGGGRPPSDLSGRLEGPVNVSGPSYNPMVSFSGRVTDLSLKGTALGAGRLQVQVGRALAGELTLDRPVPISEAGGMAGPLGSLLGGLLNGSGIQVTGATLAGTSANPKVTPKFSGVQAATQGGGNRSRGGIQLPGGIRVNLP